MSAPKIPVSILAKDVEYFERVKFTKSLAEYPIVQQLVQQSQRMLLPVAAFGA